MSILPVCNEGDPCCRERRGLGPQCLPVALTADLDAGPLFLTRISRTEDCGSALGDDRIGRTGPNEDIWNKALKATPANGIPNIRRLTDIIRNRLASFVAVQHYPRSIRLAGRRYRLHIRNARHQCCPCGRRSCICNRLQSTSQRSFSRHGTTAGAFNRGREPERLNQCIYPRTRR